jgi:predicted RNA-binding protein with PUA-like domain
MALWLFKEEPEHYSFANLQRDQATWWNGVKNSLARQHLRNVKRGDRILYYHTGKEKAVVGVMEAASDARSDADSGDSKAVVVNVKAVRRLDRPVSLARIKADPVFADWELVRLPRLSVMPVTAEQWQRLEELSQDDS